MTNNQSEERWEPTQAKLREGEKRDETSHARRNLEQLKMAEKAGVIETEQDLEKEIEELEGDN